MSHPDLITSLPSSLSCSILQGWVDFRSLRNVDRAYCNRKLRDDYLALFQSTEFIFNGPAPQDARYLQWLNARDARARNLFVSGGTDSALVEAYLAKCGQSVKSLTMGRDITSEVYASVADHCTGLTYVRVINSEVSSPEFRDILLRNQQMEDLRIHCTAFATPKFSLHNAFQGIELPHMRVLSVIHSNIAEFLYSVLRMAPNVVRLELAQHQYTSREVKTAQLRQLPNLCPHLRSLTIKKLVYDGQDDNVNFFAEIISSCAGVLHVCIEDLSMDDEATRIICSGLRDLRSLDIRHCKELTSASIKHIYTHCAETLSTLFLNINTEEGPWYDHAALDILFQRCASLRTFSLAEILFDELGRPVPYALPPAIRNLTVLLVAEDSTCNTNVLNIAKNCKDLHTLALFYSQGMCTQKSLKAIAVGCPHLREFGLCSAGFDDNTPHLFVQQLLPRSTIYNDYTIEKKYEVFESPV